MNHLYRIVWSQVTCAWVAVSATVTLGAVLAQAEPVGGQVVAGTASIAQSGAATTIRQTSQNLSLTWKSFNIAPAETVNFVQPSATAIAVNRIFDTNGTKILGQLNANGQVYLINPNGILFGQGAQVNVGALVASTLDFNDASLNGNTRTFSGRGTGSIVNQGTINATGSGGTGGYVALLGNTVRNQGTITAPQGAVALGAGSSTTLTFQNNSLVKMQVDQSVLNSLADNGGLIRADGGLVVMSAGAKNALLASVVNNTGVIEARTVQEHNGTIILLGGMTAGTAHVSGTLDASAPNGGNGGFIETSAATVKVADGTRVTTAAPQGNAGTWLIDPVDFTIAAGSGASTTSGIGATTLSNNLGSGSVSIQTLSTGVGNGDIFVNSPITKAGGGTTTLTLQAARNIDVNADITSTSGALNITLSAANTTAAASSTPGTLGGVNVNANLASNGGNILIGGGAGSTTNGIGYALNRSTSLSAVTIQANKSVTSLGGNITINGKSLVGDSSGNYSGVQGGIYILSGATILSGTGNLNMFGESSAGSKTFGLAVEANSSTVTTLGTSGTSGVAVINGINTTPGATATDRAYGALGLVNNGSIGRLSLLGRSVANMRVQVNNSTQLVTFTSGTGCVSGYLYCGTLQVPGFNNAYLYAGYSANTLATRAITVETGNGSKEYNGNASASGLSYTVTGAPVDYSTSSLRFLTSSPNVGAYAILDNTPTPNPTEYVSGGVTYAVGYYTGNYSITAKPITATYTGINKTYDRSLTASVSVSSNGVIGGDVVTFNTTSALFTDWNVGSSKTINVTGASLGGAQAGNYSLATATGSATANITAKPLTVTGLSASNKVYDGTTTATVTGTASFGGVIAGDTVTINSSRLITGAFATKDVGAGKTIDLIGVTLTGAQSGNYTVAGVSGVSATITTKALTQSGITVAASKVYDATTTAALSGTAVLQALETAGTGTTSDGKAYSGDTVSLTGTTSGAYNFKDVGAATTVTLIGTSLTGPQAGNYTLTALPNAAATITAKALTQSGITVAASKVYDATTTAALSGTAALQVFEAVGTGTSSDGKAYSGDTVSLTGAASGAYNSKDVATATTVTLSGTSLTGLQAGNYTLTALPNAAATITAKALTQSGITVAASKVYDATTAAALSGTAVLQTLETAGTGTTSDGKAYIKDTISLSGTTSGAYNFKDVATASSVTLSGTSLKGPQAGNYTLTALPNAAASISAKDVNVSGITATGKVYNNNALATLGGAAAITGGAASDSDGKYYGTDVTLSGTASGQFADANVGSAKAITVSGNTLANGTGLASNYTLRQQSGLSAAISAKDVNVSGITATGKVYNNNALATLGGAAAITGGAASDSDGKYYGTDVTLSGTASGQFADANVGSAKAITVSGNTLANGTGLASNYTLRQQSGLSADITALPVVPITVENDITHPQLNALTLQVGYQPQALNLSPTLTEMQSASTGSESTASESVNPSARSTRIKVNTQMNVNTRVMGPILQIMNIGATGITLQIMNGGIRVLDTMSNKN